ncbi:MAG: hypothetical protein U0X92_07645 [Anaerolineales bacterium]
MNSARTRKLKLAKLPQIASDDVGGRLSVPAGFLSWKIAAIAGQPKQQFRKKLPPRVYFHPARNWIHRGSSFAAVPPASLCQ